MRCGKKNNVGSLLGGEITEGFMGARWVLKASLLGLGTISAIQFKRLYLISDSVLSICVESEDFFFRCFTLEIFESVPCSISQVLR